MIWGYSNVVNLKQWKKARDSKRRTDQAIKNAFKRQQEKETKK